MRYNIKHSQNDMEEYPKLVINSEDDLSTFDRYRNADIITFDFVLQTIKDQFEIEEITADQITEIYEKLYENAYKYILDATYSIFNKNTKSY